MKRERGAIFIVSGPSGVGKTTVVNEFLKSSNKDVYIDRVVTYTTKTPRFTEVHGVDYHFITQSEFEQKISEGFFLEWSGDYGAYYGTPANIIQGVEQGQSYILVIDRKGAAQIFEQYADAILIWVQVSSIDVLACRLHGRKSESLEQIKARLLLAEKEIEQELHAPMYHYQIVNDVLSVAVQSLSGIIAMHSSRDVKNIL